MNIDISILLVILQLIALILTAFIIPFGRVWVTNLINVEIKELKKEFENKYTTQLCTNNLESKIDNLSQQFNELNQWLRENLSK